MLQADMVSAKAGDLGCWAVPAAPCVVCAHLSVDRSEISCHPWCQFLMPWEHVEPDWGSLLKLYYGCSAVVALVTISLVRTDGELEVLCPLPV